MLWVCVCVRGLHIYIIRHNLLKICDLDVFFKCHAMSISRLYIQMSFKIKYMYVNLQLIYDILCVSNKFVHTMIGL